MLSYDYLLSDISTIKGIGTKIGKLFRKKNINTIFDLLWNLPRDFVDRSNVSPHELQVGKYKHYGRCKNIIFHVLETCPIKYFAKMKLES